MSTPMEIWRLAYDQARAVDDHATTDGLSKCWDSAIDALEEEGLDSNDDDLVAARALALFMAATR